MMAALWFAAGFASAVVLFVVARVILAWVTFRWWWGAVAWR